MRGATGVPVKLCTAEVVFEIEGRTFNKRVAIAQEGMLNGKVLFAVPMDNSMAKRLLLGAAPHLKTREVGRGTPAIPRTLGHFLKRMQPLL